MRVRRDVIVAAAAGAVLVAVPAGAGAADGTTALVSATRTGRAGDDASTAASITPGGHCVAFDSDASNLVPGDSNGSGDVFVRDRAAGRTRLVSVSSAGAQGDQGSGNSYPPAISADCRYVAFASAASNLVAGDTYLSEDVFVRDLAAGTTRLVSVSSAGVRGDAPSGVFGPVAISANGRYVAFTSLASNLVPGDTHGTAHVFVRDLRARTTRLVSVADGGGPADADGIHPAISADGRYIAFSSSADNLVPGDTNGREDVFVRDMQARTTRRISVSSRERQVYEVSIEPSISADGRYVAFASDATALVRGDTNRRTDVFVRDLRAGTTSRVSVAGAGGQGNGGSLQPSISPDGRYVAFISTASNLVGNDTDSSYDVFLRDRRTRTTSLVSTSSSERPADRDSYHPSVSATGRYVAFSSNVDTLAPRDTNDTYDIFVRARW